MRPGLGCRISPARQHHPVLSPLPDQAMPGARRMTPKMLAPQILLAGPSQTREKLETDHAIDQVATFQPTSCLRAFLPLERMIVFDNQTQTPHNLHCRKLHAASIRAKPFEVGVSRASFSKLSEATKNSRMVVLNFGFNMLWAVGVVSYSGSGQG